MSELFGFLDALASNNNREWFGEHKNEYQQLRDRWTADMQRCIDTMAAAEPTLRGVDARNCLYRIYRDTRFSNDKTPYKTHFSALISPTGRHCERACWYVHAGTDECALYGGVWQPQGPLLRKLRKAIVDNAEEFREIINAPAMQRLYPGWWGRQLKTAPQGYDKNHPDIDLLRLTEYGKAHALTRRFFDDPKWPEKAAELMLVLKPMIDFLNYSIDE